MPTATLIARYPGIGGEDQHVINLAGDSSYVTGGYVITPAMFGFNAFATDGLGTGLPPVAAPYWIVGPYDTTTTAEFDIKVNPTTGALQFYVSSTGAEAASASSTATGGAILVAYGH
jgi:hypothetical protein